MAVLKETANVNGNVTTNAVVGDNGQVSARSVNISATGSNFNVSISPSATGGGFTGEAEADANSSIVSNVLAQIGGFATVTGDQGVDMRAQNQNFNPQFHSHARFYGIGPSPENDDDSGNHLHSNVIALPGGTVIAGPRPAGTPLQPTFSGFPYLALYVQAQDQNTHRTSNDRTIVWDANVTISAGVDPYLLIDQNGKIVTDDNVTVSDGTLGGTIRGVGDTISSGTAVVHDIAPGHAGQAFFIADNTASNSSHNPPYPSGHPFPLFKFDDAFSKVTLINQSAKDLEVHKIDVVDVADAKNLSGLIDVQIDGFGKNVTNIPFDFRLSHTVDPSLVDIENQLAGQLASNVILTDTINNPVGKTIVSNVRGNILAGSCRCDLVEHLRPRSQR